MAFSIPFSAVIQWLIFFIGTSFAPGAVAATGSDQPECACLCVNGIARTLCTSVAAAQANPVLCTRNFSCPALAGEDLPDATFPPPSAFAEDCRSVRIWSQEEHAYTGVKVCDVLPAQAPVPQ